VSQYVLRVRIPSSPEPLILQAQAFQFLEGGALYVEGDRARRWFSAVGWVECEDITEHAVGLA
jgi:hypothetical protein